MTMFEERWNRDVAGIFAEANGIGDDVLFNLDNRDYGDPILSPSGRNLTAETMRIQQDLKRAGLQGPQVVGRLKKRTSKFDGFGETTVNNMVLFMILAVGLIGGLLIASRPGRPRLEGRF